MQSLRRRLPLLAVLAAVAVAGFAPTSSMVVSPGQALPLFPRMTIDGAALPNPGSAATHPGRGEVLMLTIEARHANVYLWLAVSLGLSSGHVLFPRWAVIPAGMTVEQYGQFSEAQMRENTGIASVLASRATGELPAVMRGAGAFVAALIGDVEPGGLDRHDRIVGFEGHNVSFTGDMAPLLRNKAPGATVSLTVERQGQVVELRARLRPPAPGAEESMIGALLVTAQPDFSTPRALVIDSAGIGGPSGGLAIALAMYDALSDQGITGGKTIAASGFLRPDGTVGSVGGVRLKATAAARAGADLMFVSPANAGEARAGAGTMTVVEVFTFDEALAYLRAARLTPR